MSIAPQPTPSAFLAPSPHPSEQINDGPLARQADWHHSKESQPWRTLGEALAGQGGPPFRALHPPALRREPQRRPGSRHAKKIPTRGVSGNLRGLATAFGSTLRCCRIPGSTPARGDGGVPRGAGGDVHDLRHGGDAGREAILWRLGGLLRIAVVDRRAIDAPRRGVRAASDPVASLQQQRVAHVASATRNFTRMK